MCTQIYVTCGLTIKDKQQQPLAAQQCLSSCGSAARAQTFYGCVATKSGSQDTCDAAVLQTCFDAM